MIFIVFLNSHKNYYVLGISLTGTKKLDKHIGKIIRYFPSFISIGSKPFPKSNLY